MKKKEEKNRAVELLGDKPRIKCSHCGKVLDEIILQYVTSGWSSEYWSWDEDKERYSIEGDTDDETTDSSLNGVECPHCGFTIKVPEELMPKW